MTTCPFESPGISRPGRHPRHRRVFSQLPRLQKHPVSIVNKPLSDDEIDTLDAFLMSDSTPEDSLAIDELHGFLTAIVCAPDPVIPSQWLPDVWRMEEGPQFESTEQARDIVGLIMRMYNEIASVLLAGEEFGPLMLEKTLASGKSIVVAQGWCWGFMEGVRSQYEAWEPHLDAIDELLLPVAALVDLGDDDSRFHELLDDHDKVEQLTDAIPESVIGIYRQTRSEASGSPKPLRR